ncbi:MAG: sugar transferase [Planctomycetaceae bacterium]|jgi:lipopolysaccharide/colanic/teichoic acid biosynthesis glycosyltransferase|nr:sugar transferase [Planctomycetaceae bacterium]
MPYTPEPAASSWFRWKSFLDVPLALLLVIPALPLVLLAVVVVKLTSKGPGIYKQVRCGLDGKVFTIYKIRSMRANAEAATGAVWCARKDNRITAVGKIIRATHIDELPQLYNVLCGEMSLVGPRPERPEFVGELELRIDGYAYRLNVKPGITGLAQLNQASDVDLRDVRRKLVYDFDYIEHASPLLDLRLIFCTSLKVLKMCNPLMLSLFGLRRTADVVSWASADSTSTYSVHKDEERLSKIFLKQTAT